MASPIVPVDDFTATIYAPDAGDSRADAAEVVTAIAQAMADRTLHLKNLDDLKAVLAADNEFSGSNTFTGSPQYINTSDNEIPLLASTVSSLDDPDVPGNGWKTIWEFPCDATRKCRLFTGGNNPSGLMAITVNAKWHKSDSKWRPDTTASDSFGLFVITEGLFVRRQSAGTGTWSAWPAAGGDILAGATITATVLNAVANVNAFGDCNVAGNVVVAGEVTYPLGGGTPGFKPRTSLVPLAHVLAHSGVAPTVNADGNIESAAGGGPHAWPIQLPRGAVLLKIEWLIKQSTAAPSAVDGQRRLAADYGAVTLPVLATIAGGATGPAASGWRLVPNDYTGAPITISADEEYRAVWVPAVPGAGNDAVGQIRLTWHDPGPRPV